MIKLGPRHHARYWSCSKFADWVLVTFGGEAKPRAATSAKWVEWKRTNKAAAPFAYWFVETFLGKLQDVVYLPYDCMRAVRRYISNRFIHKEHYLPTRLARGEYHSIDDRILHGLFETLCDYVEVEVAWHHVMWGGAEQRARFNFPWWKTKPFFVSLKEWRCPPAGLAHLEWEMSLTCGEDMGVDPTDELYGKPTNQAVAATEIMKLYTWWRNDRPTRPDPFEASGLRAMYAASRSGGDDDWLDILNDTDDRTDRQAAHAKREALERQYDEEDTEMMIRLIKIRGSLWT